MQKDSSNFVCDIFEMYKTVMGKAEREKIHQMSSKNQPIQIHLLSQDSRDLLIVSVLRKKLSLMLSFLKKPQNNIMLRNIQIWYL